MEITDRIKKFLREKSSLAVTVLGIIGLLLILVSSMIPEKSAKKEIKAESSAIAESENTEKRLENFLSEIDGVGKAKVYISFGRSERYVYASEEKKSRSENKSEEEDKIVIVGGSDRNALIETVEPPEISGAVVVCTGGASAEVTERVYKAVSAALGIPVSKIYVTQSK